MQKQKALAKENSNFKVDYNKQLSCKFSSEFKGYESAETDSRILEIFKNGKDSVSSVSAGDDALIILDQTPFYGEKGGQIGDVGVIETTEGRFIVTDTQILGNAVAHVGYTCYKPCSNMCTSFCNTPSSGCLAAGARFTCGSEGIFRVCKSSSF